MASVFPRTEATNAFGGFTSRPWAPPMMGSVVHTCAAAGAVVHRWAYAAGRALDAA
ncbi:hypothetical protein [Terrabacter sp. MAHUQ-38]|uniref:hypothetical protein n=1 Tax=unclassified Terrabacter TaxID=2630222 RepID=UPI00165E262A|nr:hypothetical protein [Terrabacter sp. MAHUQ-38]MBC9822467.1 hypothetical protein [Terrabacter sp. MAHUQ-38]